MSAAVREESREPDGFDREVLDQSVKDNGGHVRRNRRRGAVFGDKLAVHDRGKTLADGDRELRVRGKRERFTARPGDQLAERLDLPDERSDVRNLLQWPVGREGSGKLYRLRVAVRGPIQYGFSSGSAAARVTDSGVGGPFADWAKY